MNKQTLLAISPLDGRYANKLNNLNTLVSEYALIRNRIIVEISWLKLLLKQEQINSDLSLDIKKLDDIVNNFDVDAAQKVKELERTTNHDVKAVEYYIRNELQHYPEFMKYSELVHFACTSEDINNVAYALMLRDLRTQIILPTLERLQQQLTAKVNDFAGCSMLSRTHGQAASPTTMGKEISNFCQRLIAEVKNLSSLKIYAKLNGAVGNYNAHYVAYPQINWPQLTEELLQELGLNNNQYTTQIEPHDYIAGYSHNLIRINNILLDFSRDIWSYIAIGYFQQKFKAQEVGSSTMPHKINPIDFENAEGNLGIANALLQHFANKLPISRWQRDLSDSTVLRNIGSAVAHSFLAWQSLLRGNEKITLNQQQIKQDLYDNLSVLTEAYQTIMRSYGIEDAYEKLKDLSRGQQLTLDLLHNFVEQQQLPDHVKKTLQQITPENYIGIAKELALQNCKDKKNK